MLHIAYSIILKKTVMKKATNFLLVLLFFSLYSCTDSNRDYTDRFNTFVNEVELSQDQYDDDEWILIEADFNELSKVEFINFKDELTESELNQVKSYRERFKAVKIKRSPIESILEIIGF